MNITAQMIQDYLKDNNDAKRITEAEAIARGGQRVERQFNALAEGRNSIYAGLDPLAFIANIAIEVSSTFMNIFSDDQYRVGWFTGYTVEEIPANMGRVFKVSTIAVSMSEREWHG